MMKLDTGSHPGSLVLTALGISLVLAAPHPPGADARPGTTASRESHKGKEIETATFAMG